MHETILPNFSSKNENFIQLVMFHIITVLGIQSVRNTDGHCACTQFTRSSVERFIHLKLLLFTEDTKNLCLDISK